MTNSYLKNLLGENERIIFAARQHWLVLLGRILPKSLLVLALFILITLVWRIWFPYPLVPLAYLLLLLPLGGLIWDILVWANRQYVVTDWRVIQIWGVLSKDVIDSSLEKVNDVKLEQSFWGRLLNYGDIEILTASELGVNRFRRVWRPIQLKTAMLNAKEKLEHNKSEHSQAGQGSGSEMDIVGLIGQLENLRRQGVLTEEEFQRKKAELLSKL